MNEIMQEILRDCKNSKKGSQEKEEEPDQVNLLNQNQNGIDL